MLPTLRPKGDSILVEKLSVHWRRLKRGDVVVVTSPSNPDRLICKRIIGLVQRCQVSVLLHLQETDYVASAGGPGFSTTQVWHATAAPAASA